MSFTFTPYENSFAIDIYNDSDRSCDILSYEKSDLGNNKWFLGYMQKREKKNTKNGITRNAMISKLMKKIYSKFDTTIIKLVSTEC